MFFYSLFINLFNFNNFNFNFYFNFNFNNLYTIILILIFIFITFKSIVQFGLNIFKNLFIFYEVWRSLVQNILKG
jgi:hypothetical protein